MTPVRLAILVSHPIQHFVPLYRALASDPRISLRVIFCTKIGLDKYFDKDMNTNISWAGDLTSGYDFEFLPEAVNIKKVGTFEVNNPSVSRALSSFSPDYVMLYGYAQITQLRALAWCRAHGIPTLMTTDSNAVQVRTLLKRIVRQTAVRAILSQVSAFLTAGDQNEVALRRLGISEKKMYRSPLTIDEQSHRQARSDVATRRERIRNLYGIPQGSFLAVSVGKIIPRKRVGDVVEAISESARRSPGRDIRLIICGDGPGKDEISKNLTEEGRIILAGFVNIDKLPDYYAASDVLIHAASEDAHPLICSEAACMGLPMIVSDMVGTIGRSDVCREGENTLVFPCGDVNKLVECILNISSSDELRKAMGDSSIQIYEQCDLRASVEGIIAAIEATSTSSGRAN